MSDEVGIAKEVVGLVSAAGGFGASLLYQVKKSGRDEERFNAVEQKAKETAEELERLQAHHEADMRDMQNWFRTDSGGQKFMTFPDHDLVCERNGRATALAISQMTKAVENLTAQVCILGDQTMQLKVAVGVMQAAGHKGGTK